MADSRALLGSIDSSMSILTAQVSKMSETLDVVRSGVPMSMGYCWGPEQPILLLDGLGRQISLPLMLASSPDVGVNTACKKLSYRKLISHSQVFRDVLLIMHRDTPGYDKIKSGKYVVSDEDSGGALVPKDKWQDSFQPGRHIGLSFLLRHPGARDEKECPRCRAPGARPGNHPGQRRWCVGFLIG